LYLIFGKDMTRKQILLYIVLFATCGIVVLVLVFAAFTRKAPTTSEGTPLPIPTKIEIDESHRPTPTLPPQTALSTIVSHIDNRQTLSPADLQVRQSLISNSNQTGVIAQKPTFTFHYSSDADVFQVEITTSNITTATSEALTWLHSQGLSDAGICNLPVVVFRDPKSFDPTITTGLEFYSLPLTCQ